MHSGSLITALMVAVVASVATAGPIQTRQIANLAGSPACNNARAQIVTAVGDLKTSISQIQDPTVKAAAQAGLTKAQGGIGQVAQGLKSGAPPSAEGRDNVQAGLIATNAALSNASVADPGVASAKIALGKAVQAGSDVLANC